MMWGTGWGGWLMGLAMMVLFWGGLIAVLIFALRGWDADRRADRRDRTRPDARAILEERFARGEISADEFEQRRKVLGNAT